MPHRSKLHTFITSFRFRLFIIFTLGTALISAVLTTTYIVREENEYRTLARDRARLLAGSLATSIRIPLFSNDRKEMQSQLDDVAGQSDVALVRVTGPDGISLAEVLNKGTSGDSIRESWRVMTRGDTEPDNLALGGHTSPLLLGTVLVELDTVRLRDSIRHMTLTTSFYALVFWLVVIVVSYLTLGKFTRSYQRLMDGIDEMRAGNLHVAIPIEGKDEPARAAMAVNEMALALRKREEENRELQEKLLENMRSKLEETQKLNMAKMIQTNRMTSLGLLVASMAHEINNPNGAIRLEGSFLGKILNELTALIAEREPDCQEIRIAGMEFPELCRELQRSHKNLLENTTRIESVIKELRTYSLGGGNAPHQTDVDANLVVVAAITIIRSLGRFTNARIEEDFCDVLPHISGSHHQLEQVVINLLLNALQSLSLRGGTVCVSTALDPVANEVLITIRDTGEGIPQENLSRLYEPFFSTRVETGGSGLGLYISNFIISEHKGSLEFTSEVGNGTVATIHLPIPAATT